jgi:hypothetical protein
MDCPWTSNYDACLRYYHKTYDYNVAAGTPASGNNGTLTVLPNTAVTAQNSGITFPKPMARTPTVVTIYNHATGAANSMRDIAGVDHAITSLAGPSNKTPFFAINSTGLTAGVTGACWLHYTADTAW